MFGIKNECDLSMVFLVKWIATYGKVDAPTLPLLETMDQHTTP